MIRLIEEKDYQAVYEICCWYVENTVYNLDWSCPTKEEFIQGIKENTDFPFYVSEVDGEVIGYGTAHHYKAKLGYEFDVDMTIYFRQGNHHGEAARMMEQLYETLSRQHVCTAVSCITGENEPSLRFHKKQGFIIFGELEDAAYKDGRWVDVVWMKKTLQDPPEDMDGFLFIPYSELSKADSPAN